MTDLLTLSGSRAAAAGPLRLFRLLYGINLGLRVLAALAAILAPAFLAHLFNLPFGPDASPWIRVFGTLLLVAALFELPGWLSPVDGRLTVILGLVGRILLLVVFLLVAGGFWWLALYEAVFGLALGWSFQSMIKTEIMTRP